MVNVLKVLTGLPSARQTNPWWLAVVAPRANGGWLGPGERGLRPDERFGATSL